MRGGFGGRFGLVLFGGEDRGRAGELGAGVGVWAAGLSGGLYESGKICGVD